jgi:radical SAM superfamily enzyme YgiQ (UPF0313 family)
LHALIFTGMPRNNKNHLEHHRSAGAYRLSTYFRRQGWDIEVLDFMDSWTLEELKEYTRSRVTSDTQWIGFGATFPVWTPIIAEFIVWIKTTWPRITIIAGGAQSYLYQGADWYIYGFGERALEALLKHLAGTLTEPLRYRLGPNGKKSIYGNTDYPSYPMSDLSIVYEDRDFIKPQETLVTELGRGCRFKCSFCNFPILGVKEDHTRTADNFRDELRLNYDSWGVTNYMLADETVNDYTEKLIKFAGAVDQLKFRPTLNGFARADLLVSRPRDWDIMIQMGFIGHHYGIESTNYETLKAIGKGMHPDRLLPGLLDARKYFKSHSLYRGTMSLIVGLPFETPDTWLKTKMWILKNWQGDSSIAYPLFIPAEGQTQTPSLLTEHWSKYGYRKVDTNYFDQVSQYIKENGMTKQLQDSIYLTADLSSKDSGMNWENEHWSRLSATLEVGNWLNTYHPYNSPDIWSIGQWLLATSRPREFFNNKNNKEIQLDLSRSTGLIADAKHDVITKEYILKKINWQPRPSRSQANKLKKSDPGL